MGLYQRKDSPFWWMTIEATGQKKSTGIPIDGGSPAQNKELQRQASGLYATTQAAAVLAANTPDRKPIISFTAQADWYEQHHAIHQRSAVRAISMLNTLRKYFSPVADLALIDAAAAKEWMTWRKNQVGASTVNRELDILKAVLRTAVPKYLAANPLTGLGRFRVDEHEPRVLTVEEEQRLLAVCGPEDRAWLLMALDTLLRLSSVIHLQWAQVKLDRRVLVPLNAKVSTKPKPISPRLHEALTAIQRPKGPVFLSFHADGDGPQAAKNRVTRRFDALCQLAVIPHGRAAGGLTFHCLRHTGATRALQAGYSVRTVMELGGWLDERTVMRYVHASDSDVIAAAAAIGKAVT